MWENKKLLLTSNFSFSYNVSYSFRELSTTFIKSKIVLCNLFNPFPNKPWFLWIYSTSLLKTLWEKEKMLVTSIFSFSHSVFYSIRKINHHFSNIQLVVCKCFQFGHVRNSVVWERVKFGSVYNFLFGKGLKVPSLW